MTVFHVTDGSSYSFIRTIGGWESCEMIDEGLGNSSEYTVSFEKSLDRLLMEVNMRPGKY